LFNFPEHLHSASLVINPLISLFRYGSKVLQCAAQEGHKGVILYTQNRLKQIIKTAYLFLINYHEMVNDFAAKPIFACNTNSCYQFLL